MSTTTEQIRCQTCQVDKDLASFQPSVARRKKGSCRACTNEKSRRWYSNNKPSHDARVKDWARRNPDAKLNRHLIRNYGISLVQYQEILASQGGGCALCGKAQGGEKMRLAVDHCHATGKVRGILCHHCNQALGALGDSETGLLKALAYLRNTTLEVR